MNNSKLSISLFTFVAVLFAIGVIPYETQNAFADNDHGIKSPPPDRPRDSLGNNCGGGNNGGGNTGSGNTGSNTGSSNYHDDYVIPTLGVTSSGDRLVSNGFTFNGYSVGVERFFTDYPLITVNVGKTNKADFKIYDNQGPDYIKHFSFAFGLAKSQTINESKVMIELDIHSGISETVTVIDPENALDNVQVETSIVSCSDNSTSECLGITILYNFREPLDFNMVATDVWDVHRNTRQNYFNHGIEVIGNSLNLLEAYDGHYRDYTYHLTETSKTTEVDEFGDSWSLKYGQWDKDYIPHKKIVDEIAMNGYPREHAIFNTYKYGQHLLAEHQLTKICSKCLDEYYTEIGNSFFYDNISSSDYDKLQMNKFIEFEHAQKTMNHLLDPLLYRK